MLPPEPGLLSTITGCPSDTASFSVNMRATRSGELPAGKGTTMWIGLEGHGSAARLELQARADNAAANSFFIAPPGSLLLAELDFSVRCVAAVRCAIIIRYASGGTMAKNDLPVIIVGGGIGGFAAALALTQKGFPVHLIERASDFAEIGAGIQLGPNVFRMFELLGVRDAMSHWAVFPDNLIMRDALDGSEITRIPAGEPLHRHFGYPYAVIHRADLHNVLIDAVKRSALATLTTNCKITGYEDRGDRVVVGTEDGNSHQCAALIGADGLWSVVRGQVV